MSSSSSNTTEIDALSDASILAKTTALFQNLRGAVVNDPFSKRAVQAYKESYAPRIYCHDADSAIPIDEQLKRQRLNHGKLIVRVHNIIDGNVVAEHIIDWRWDVVNMKQLRGNSVIISNGSNQWLVVDIRNGSFWKNQDNHERIPLSDIHDMCLINGTHCYAIKLKGSGISVLRVSEQDMTVVDVLEDLFDDEDDPYHQRRCDRACRIFNISRTAYALYSKTWLALWQGERLLGKIHRLEKHKDVYAGNNCILLQIDSNTQRPTYELISPAWAVLSGRSTILCGLEDQGLPLNVAELVLSYIPAVSRATFRLDFSNFPETSLQPAGALSAAAAANSARRVVIPQESGMTILQNGVQVLIPLYWDGEYLVNVHGEIVPVSQ